MYDICVCVSIIVVVGGCINDDGDVLIGDGEVIVIDLQFVVDAFVMVVMVCV